MSNTHFMREGMEWRELEIAIFYLKDGMLRLYSLSGSFGKSSNSLIISYVNPIL